jgi:hypothetical protein
MRLTRRQLLVGAAGGVLGAAGVYELVDQLTTAPRRPAAAAPTPEPEQHLLGGLRVIEDNGVEVIVPPLHHQVVTAKLRVGEGATALRQAQADLEEALARLDERFEQTPAGLGVTIAWGLPYFTAYVPRLAERYLPVDRRASRALGKEVRALVDAIRFPSDPDETILESNHVAVLLRSDSLANIAAGAKALFDELDVFEPTSIRKGFAGGGFDGGMGLPKRMALAAGVRSAELIPDGSELFLGFTSTQRKGLGPPKIANLETLGFSDGGPGGYFREGTHMHLSHMDEDVEAWFINFGFRERVDTAFRPGLEVAEGTQTVPQAEDDVVDEAAVRRDFESTRTMGHSASIQTTSRLREDVRGPDGTLYTKGTAIPHRADFNTLDNPFFWSADPIADGSKDEPTFGLHFVVFNPTSDDFHRNRLAMDGVLPDGTKLPFAARDRGQGFNSVLRTTHRQNLLVPPRRHRSFPLAELLR